MTKVLFVGIATLDVVNVVSEYPKEDAEVRASDQMTRRGGNAANSAVICAQLGNQCHWLGTLADDAQMQIICADLMKYGVDFQHAPRIPASHTPTSYISLSQQTGSRTIVHYRKLPELSAADFRVIDPKEYAWIHFEGRNVSETLAMMKGLRAKKTKPLVSLELEKNREGIERLVPFADLVFFSKQYVQTQPIHRPADFLGDLHHQYPMIDFVAAWGDQGAWLQCRDQAQATLIPTPNTIQLVDSVGAGDSFNGAIISALLEGKPLQDAVLYAHGIAAKKCQRMGFDLA